MNNTVRDTYRNKRVSMGKGFTLIELMTVVAVIAILAAIALPSYQKSVQKARRVDAKNAVLDFAAREEKFFATNNTYSNTAAALGYSALPVNVNSSGSSYYQLSVTLPATGGFIAKATPTGSQQTDACYAYQINELGVESNVDSGGATLAATDCW